MWHETAIWVTASVATVTLFVTQGRLLYEQWQDRRRKSDKLKIFTHCQAPGSRLDGILVVLRNARGSEVSEAEANELIYEMISEGTLVLVQQGATSTYEARAFFSKDRPVPQEPVPARPATSTEDTIRRQQMQQQQQ